MTWDFTIPPRYRKLTAFLIYSVTTFCIVLVVRNVNSAWATIAAVLGSYTSGFTALMWGNSKEHEHEAKSIVPSSEVKP
jgi:hypothetical protein